MFKVGDRIQTKFQDGIWLNAIFEVSKINLDNTIVVEVIKCGDIIYLHKIYNSEIQDFYELINKTGSSLISKRQMEFDNV